MQNVNGILLILMAMAAFTIEDLFVKHLSATIPVGELLFFFGLGGGLIFATMCLVGRHRIFRKAAWTPIFIFRSLAEAVSAVFFVSALSLVDISVVAAVFQATPLVLTVGGALFLGETVGWRRMTAVFVGFIGVMMIIRPGLDGFDPNTMFVLVAVFGVAARDLITRKMDTSVHSSVVSFQGVAIVAPTGLLLLAITGTPAVTPDPQTALMIACGVAFGALGYYGIVQGMRIGDASAVAPFRYARLVFSLLGGILVFKERPDLMTLLGAGLIIATGLYTFLRERKLAAQM